MTVTALIAITLLCIAWSLWIRRVTWTCRWEVAATLNIALQGCAVVLISPWASATLGVWLHRVTGKWNIEDWIGHICYIVAASAIVYNAISRLDDDEALRAKFRSHVEYPATLCIALLLTVLSLSNVSNVYCADFLDARSDGWLAVYWMLLCGFLTYLLVYGSRALLILRRSPSSRTIAGLYLLASASGILACLAGAVISVVPAFQTSRGSLLVWVLAAACGGGFALISAHSWRIKLRWFTPSVKH